MLILCELLFSQKALDSYDKSKGIMLDPNKTYAGIPYYFGIDPVSTKASSCGLLSCYTVNAYTRLTYSYYCGIH